MHIDVFTLSPEVFESPFKTGIFQRAFEKNILSLNVHNIRDYTHDKHNIVDDTPYGGGSGMLMKPEPIFEAVENIAVNIDNIREDKAPIILLSPQGRLFNQQVAAELAQYKNLMLICGQYEGVDERVRDNLATDVISVGDYVLSGGEIAAMVVINAIARLIPGVLGCNNSHADDSHSGGLLEYPQYTRPPEFRGRKVPEILLSGNHGEIAKWRRQQQIIRTASVRPDLLDSAELSEEELALAKKYIGKADGKSKA